MTNTETRIDQAPFDFSDDAIEDYLIEQVEAGYFHVGYDDRAGRLIFWPTRRGAAEFGMDAVAGI